MQLDDTTLIDRFLAGDPGAVGTVDRWLSGAARPYRRRLGPGWDDLLQDLRLEVTRLFRRRRFRGDGGLRGYLSRVASNACLNRLDHQRRWGWTELPEAPAETFRGGGGAEERLACREMARDVLERLPPECRRLCALLQAGYSYREMSLRLGVEEVTLRSRVSRCRRRACRLRELLLTGGVV